MLYYLWNGTHNYYTYNIVAKEYLRPLLIGRKKEKSIVLYHGVDAKFVGTGRRTSTKDVNARF